MTDGYKIKRGLIRVNGVEKQFYPATWNPGANTLLYLSLNGNTTDTSLSPKTVTNNGNAGYTTISSGLKVLNLTGNEYLSASLDIGTIFTINYYIYLSGTGVQMLWSYGPDSNLGLYYNSGSLQNWAWGSNAISGYTLNTWNMITTVHSGGNRTTYLNGVYQSNHSIGISYTSGEDFYVGSNLSNFKTTGLYSNFIVEDKAWTADEITAYYNLTKSNYGL